MAGISRQLSSHYKTPLMMSLKEVRNQLLISHNDGVINDEELLLLCDLNRSDNVDLPYNSYPGFAFDDLEDDECLSEFRFYKNDLPFLAEVLEIPEVAECYQRSICSGLEALCIFLKRQLSLSIFRHDSSLWESCSSVMHDKQLHDRLHLPGTQSQNFAVE